MHIVRQWVCLGGGECTHTHTHTHTHTFRTLLQLQALINEGLLASNMTTSEKPRSQQESYNQVARLPEKVTNEFITFPWTVRTLQNWLFTGPMYQVYFLVNQSEEYQEGKHLEPILEDIFLEFVLPAFFFVVVLGCL